MTTIRLALVHSAAILSLVAGPAAAQLAVPAGTVREGTLSFDGRATAGAFTGTTRAVTGEMTGGGGLSDVRGWVEAPVNTLKTGNNRRDRDLNKSMESEKYPTIRFELTGVTAAEPPRRLHVGDAPGAIRHPRGDPGGLAAGERDARA